MTGRPLVSVVMIFLNAERFMEEAIASVLTQRYDHWELLLVDDGSTDGSTAIAMAHAMGAPDRIRYLEHPGHTNLGMGAARTLGTSAARGSLLAFIDADDVWLPGKLEEQVGLLAAHPAASIVVGSPLYWYGWSGDDDAVANDHEAERTYPADRVIAAPELLMLTAPFGSGAVPCPSDVLVRRDAALRVGGFEPLFRGAYEDVAFFSKLLLDEPAYVASSCWTKYRVHPDSCMSTAVAEGRYQSARIRFLNWYEQYLARYRRDHAEVWDRLQVLLQPYRLPLKMIAMDTDPAAPLRAEPNPVPRDSSTTTLSWDTGDGSAGYIWVVQDGGGEAFFAEGSRGVQDAPWINPGSVYEFRLYGDEQRRRLLHAVTVCRIPDPDVGGESFGSLRRVVPVSREFGFDRGQPIDRYYIDRFLAEHAADIRGRVLEIGESTYTRRFGGAAVGAIDVLHVTPGNPEATIVADLADGAGIPAGAFDCILLLQTLHLIYDVKAALRTVHRALRPGGVVLATFPGLSQRSRDEWSDIWYWGFTSRSARRLFGDVFGGEHTTVRTYGNVLASSAFLYGLAASELSAEELDYTDDSYETLVTVRAAGK